MIADYTVILASGPAKVEVNVAPSALLRTLENRLPGALPQAIAVRALGA